MDSAYNARSEQQKTGKAAEQEEKASEGTPATTGAPAPKPKARAGTAKQGKAAAPKAKQAAGAKQTKQAKQPNKAAKTKQAKQPNKAAEAALAKQGRAKHAKQPEPKPMPNSNRKRPNRPPAPGVGAATTFYRQGKIHRSDATESWRVFVHKSDRCDKKIRWHGDEEGAWKKALHMIDGAA